jgi:hypothetical protein
LLRGQGIGDARHRTAFSQPLVGVALGEARDLPSLRPVDVPLDQLLPVVLVGALPLVDFLAVLDRILHVLAVVAEDGLDDVRGVDHDRLRACVAGRQQAAQHDR